MSSAPTATQGFGMGVRIIGTGIGLPDRILTNHDLAQQVDTSDAWITQRTGIRQRYIAAPDQNSRHLGVIAARQAMANAGIKGADLDLVMVATMTPEMSCPSTAARLAADIGASPAGAMDLSAACSGFVYALNLAESHIRLGRARRILIVGAETMNKVVNWEDRRTCILFGDGAGAAILEADNDTSRGCLHQNMYSDGNAWKELYVPGKETELPDPATFDGQIGTLQMNGQEVFKFAVTHVQTAIELALRETGLEASDLNLIIPHQSNRRILELIRTRLSLPSDAIYINIDRYGNTSAASVPIALHELNEAGRLQPGQLNLFVAVGGGMTWTTSLWRM